MLKTILKKNSDMNGRRDDGMAYQSEIGSNSRVLDKRYNEMVKRHEKFLKVGGSCHVTPERFRSKKSCVEFADPK